MKIRLVKAKLNLFNLVILIILVAWFTLKDGYRDVSPVITECEQSGTPELSYRDIEDFIVKVNPDIRYKSMRRLLEVAPAVVNNTGLTLVEYLSIAGIESQFKKDAVSPTGDYGMFQINKITYFDFCERRGLFTCQWDKIHTIAHNTEAAAMILSVYRQVLLRKYPDLPRSELTLMLIMKYNTGGKKTPAGKNYVRKWEKIMEESK